MIPKGQIHHLPDLFGSRWVPARDFDTFDCKYSDRFRQGANQLGEIADWFEPVAFIEGDRFVLEVEGEGP